jgi:2,4-diaminopentanoate dehydrogenase
MTLRVVHWGTGSTGRHGLRAIVQHPDLELVGWVVHSPDKVGRDAGEFCGLAANGVLGTHDIASVLALDPHCLSYMSNGVGREREVVADIAPFLEHGTNVVTCSLIPFIYPPITPAALLDPAEVACNQGRSSLFNSGIDPGYATGDLVASLLSLASEVESVRVQELGNFSRYGAGTMMREIFGFGQPSSYFPPLFSGGMLTHFWNGTIGEIARLLDIAIDEIRLVHDVATVDHAVETAFGRIDAGTIGAVHFELQGMHHGRPVVVVEHIDRISPDAGPQWDKATGTEATAYRVVITGRPSFSCELDFTLAGGVSGAVVATATYLVNAIAAVCAAAPGVLGRDDIAPFVGPLARR